MTTYFSAARRAATLPAWFLLGALLVSATQVGGAPLNIAPDGFVIVGVAPDTTGASDVSNINQGPINQLNDEVYFAPGPYNIPTGNGADNYYAGPAETSFELDYFGVLWDTPKNNVTAFKIQNYLANDGGWWGPTTTTQGGVPLAADEIVPPEVQVTTNGGTSWTTISSTNDYVDSYTGVVRGIGFPQTNTGPFATFSFAPQSGINGIRLIGDAAGSVDPNGFVSATEIIVLQETGMVFPTLDVNTSTGELTLNTGSGAGLGIKGYSITSDVGALNPAEWESVADNYDAGSAGPNQIDSDDSWTELTAPSNRTDLSEAELSGGDGGTLGSNLSLSLGDAWIQNPFGDDLRMEVLLDDGRTRRVDVTYNGASNNPLQLGDINGDGSLTAADWATVRDNYNSTFPGMTDAEAYAFGDLNRDGVNNELDFAQFKALYNAANGSGSFEAMVAAVPEPSSVAVLAAGLVAMWGLRLRLWGKRVA